MGADVVTPGFDIVLGGPDPFPNERAGNCPEPQTDSGYECTRDAGHPLPHVALGEVVYAVWPPYRELPA